LQILYPQRAAFYISANYFLESFFVYDTIGLINIIRGEHLYSEHHGAHNRIAYAVTSLIMSIFGVFLLIAFLYGLTHYRYYAEDRTPLGILFVLLLTIACNYFTYPFAIKGMRSSSGRGLAIAGLAINCVLSAAILGSIAFMVFIYFSFRS